jgi:hypothetical protein
MGKKWQSIKVSVDLLKASGESLEFLQEVAKHPELHEETQISNSLRRYEQLWLPLLRNNNGEDLLPPLDVHWVWHCHMLAPQAYNDDCMRLLGRIAGHKFFLSEKERINATGKTRTLWNQFYGSTEPFDSPSMIPDFASQLSYDIRAAAKRQKSFFYNVSLPHYRNKAFRAKAVERYKKFLHLKRVNPRLFTVPMYDVDLIWHTHQAHPIAYQRDTIAVLGHILNHDDTTTDRSPESFLTQSDSETRAAWQLLYKESFPIGGVMYRGEPPAGKLYNIPSEDLDLIFWKTVVFSVEKIELNGNLCPQFSNLYCKIRCSATAQTANTRDRDVHKTDVIKSGSDGFQWPTATKPGSLASFKQKVANTDLLCIKLKKKLFIGGKPIAVLTQKLELGTREQMMGIHRHRISKNLPAGMEVIVETNVSF